MLRYRTKRAANGLDVRFYRLFEALHPVKICVQFRPDSIGIVTRILGIPVGRKLFDSSQIYGLGYAVHGHSRSQVLQFTCVGGSQIILASDVQEDEAAAFVKFLHQQGLDYEASWKLPPSASSPSFVTGL